MLKTHILLRLLVLFFLLTSNSIVSAYSCINKIQLQGVNSTISKDLKTYYDFSRQFNVAVNCSLEKEIKLINKILGERGSCCLIKNNVFNRALNCYIEAESILFVNNNIKRGGSNLSQQKLLIWISGIDGINMRTVRNLLIIALQNNQDLLVVDYTGYRFNYVPYAHINSLKLATGVIFFNKQFKQYYSAYTSFVIDKAIQILLSKNRGIIYTVRNKEIIKIDILGYSFGGHITQSLIRTPLIKQIYNIILIAPALIDSKCAIPVIPDHKVKVTIIAGLREQILNLNAFGFILNPIAKLLGFSFTFNHNMQIAHEISQYEQYKWLSPMIIQLPYGDHYCYRFVLQYMRQNPSILKSHNQY